MKLFIAILKNIGVIVLAIVIFAVGQIIGGVIEEYLPVPYVNVILGCIIRIAVTMGLGWLFAVKGLKISAKDLGIVLKPGKTDLLLYALAVLLPVLMLVFYIFILPGREYVAGKGYFWLYFVNAVFSVGIPAGITEELVFRGLIFRYMERTLGVKIAVIVPALLFASVHISNMKTFDIVDLLLLLFAGSTVAILFTMYALRSGSIYPGAFAHAIWNALIIGGIFGMGEIVNGEVNDSYIIVPIESASKLLTGGNFGVEATVPGIIGYSLFALIIFLVGRKAGSTEGASLKAEEEK
ncbi:MAG: CPBP family intramembrane metalloprotease [Lachnospiraceae bacterium]|nr:CPBP family intramembrane metalloprotease [Lachnospiraceae bacterium]